MYHLLLGAHCMNDLVKWFVRVSFIGIFWVFFLSITINGRSIFSYANDVLVQNSFVQFLDEELADLWSKIAETAKVTFSEMSEGDRKA